MLAHWLARDGQSMVQVSSMYVTRSSGDYEVVRGCQRLLAAHTCYTRQAWLMLDDKACQGAQERAISQ